MRISYFVDIMPALAMGVDSRRDRPTHRLPERFDDLEEATEFALGYVEERERPLIEWSFNIVDETGIIVLTYDDPEPPISPTAPPARQPRWWQALWR